LKGSKIFQNFKLKGTLYFQMMRKPSTLFGIKTFATPNKSVLRASKICESLAVLVGNRR